MLEFFNFKATQRKEKMINFETVGLGYIKNPSLANKKFIKILNYKFQKTETKTGQIPWIWMAAGSDRKGEKMKEKKKLKKGKR